MRHYGVLGGSDLVKIMEQLGRTVITDYDYVVAHTNGELIGTQSLKSFLGEDKLKTWISQLKGTSPRLGQNVLLEILLWNFKKFVSLGIRPTRERIRETVRMM
ncbi:phosphomannomutase-like isoform X5 [Panicum virgatum]|uniref:phosphomannomutase-like isoform X5 n=1 Tax=Panicum virgatum TaxID=38727 RepID=UPI0019D630F9|nr:phosphomannomutase-like isoform X5 [Panicum virgatum]